MDVRFSQNHPQVNEQPRGMAGRENESYPSMCASAGRLLRLPRGHWHKDKVS
jgi:hypothetical protein